MQIHILAVGKRMPDWVTKGYQEYAKRLSGACRLHLIEIAPAYRSAKTNARQATEEEGKKMLAAIDTKWHVVALAIHAPSCDSEGLSQRLDTWMASGQDVALLVGGADGLSQACQTRANASWSLSPLTFPHPLVRIMLAEQLYRAWTLLQHHPYHH